MDMLETIGVDEGTVLGGDIIPSVDRENSRKVMGLFRQINIHNIPLFVTMDIDIFLQTGGNGHAPDSYEGNLYPFKVLRS
jgi:hypothetical protein